MTGKMMKPFGFHEEVPEYNGTDGTGQHTSSRACRHCDSSGRFPSGSHPG